ncbi:MAG: DUF4124 domain-containing protein [Rhodanobacteraceae bacterium]
MCLVLTAIFMLVPAGAAAEQTIYTCKSPNGTIVFADAPCGPKARLLVLHGGSPPHSLPMPSPAPAGMLESPSAAPPMVSPKPVPSESPAFRCTTPDGMVFYRHQHCPKAITVTRHRYVGGLDTPIPGYTPVNEQGVSSDVACAKIHAVDASDRFGSDYDEHYTTYQRNAGDDPCE